jgi:hypothetical protein
VLAPGAAKAKGERPISHEICEQGHEFFEVADVPAWREYEFPELKVPSGR